MDRLTQRALAGAHITIEQGVALMLSQLAHDSSGHLTVDALLARLSNILKPEALTLLAHQEDIRPEIECLLKSFLQHVEMNVLFYRNP